jgi:hypothetical protein
LQSRRSVELVLEDQASSQIEVARLERVDDLDVLLERAGRRLLE